MHDLVVASPESVIDNPDALSLLLHDGKILEEKTEVLNVIFSVLVVMFCYTC